MIVLDASAMLELLLGTPKGQQVREQYVVEGESFHVPHLLDLEVAQVLRRYASRGLLSDHRTRQALQDFLDFPLIRYSHEPFLPRIWALRDSISAYDAIYMALAEVLSIPLLTGDARLASSPQLSATMILV